MSVGYPKRLMINGEAKRESHYIWFLNTDYWPDFKNKQEIIHHLDGDTHNNIFSNLALMTSSEHTSLHKRGKNNPMYGRKRWKRNAS